MYTISPSARLAVSRRRRPSTPSPRTRNVPGAAMRSTSSLPSLARGHATVGTGVEVDVAGRLDLRHPAHGHDRIVADEQIEPGEHGEAIGDGCFVERWQLPVVVHLHDLADGHLGLERVQRSVEQERPPLSCERGGGQHRPTVAVLARPGEVGLVVELADLRDDEHEREQHQHDAAPRVAAEEALRGERDQRQEEGDGEVRVPGCGRVRPEEVAAPVPGAHQERDPADRERHRDREVTTDRTAEELHHEPTGHADHDDDTDHLEAGNVAERVGDPVPDEPWAPLGARLRRLPGCHGRTRGTRPRTPPRAPPRSRSPRASRAARTR